MAIFSRRPRDDERRAEPRKALNTAGLVVAPDFEIACAILDISPNGMRIRLVRDLALPPRIVVVEITTGLAHEAEVARRDGHEVGLKRRVETSIRGLAPQRLAAARQAWIRAAGR
jgi:hypothetical protein